MLYAGSNEGAPGPYGLWLEQPTRNQRRARGGFSSWLNRKGEVMGYGQLHLDDLERIAREIGANELFVVVAKSSPRGNYYHADMEGLSPTLASIILRDRIPFLVRRGELVIVTPLSNRKLTTIDRDAWEVTRKKCLERGQPVPPRIMAWHELASDIRISEIGSYKALSLLSLPG